MALARCTHRGNKTSSLSYDWRYDDCAEYEVHGKICHVDCRECSGRSSGNDPLWSIVWRTSAQRCHSPGYPGLMECAEGRERKKKAKRAASVGVLVFCAACGTGSASECRAAKLACAQVAQSRNALNLKLSRRIPRSYGIGLCRSSKIGLKTKSSLPLLLGAHKYTMLYQLTSEYVSAYNYLKATFYSYL